MLLRMEKTGAQKRLGHKISVRPDQPALTQLIEHPRIVKSHKELAEKTIKVFANMRFLDLVPDRMRQAAFPGQTILGNGGENLPTVLREICDDPKRKETLAEWTRKLTPMDVRDFEFPIEEVSGRVQLVFREANNRRVSAYGASDGTLRFLAMLAALLGTNPAGLYFFEEIDNGIHPARLNLLMDLIERQTAKHSTQVLTTTHAPTLLTVMNDNTFEKTSVVCRLQDTSEAIIRPVAELPNVRELRQDQGLGRLHESGWMEDALFFIEDYNAAEDGS
ncbi:MAG: ATP-binding protein [Gemmatimonadetes bacterium]|nr:ATP-binding protein [Gemmatimonadota bacterium]